VPKPRQVGSDERYRQLHDERVTVELSPTARG
jgi:hypothetical protein